MKARVTVRGEGVELRGYMDPKYLVKFSQAMTPFGLVMASPIEDDYDPFESVTP